MFALLSFLLCLLHLLRGYHIAYFFNSHLPAVLAVSGLFENIYYYSGISNLFLPLSEERKRTLLNLQNSFFPTIQHCQAQTSWNVKDPRLGMISALAIFRVWLMSFYIRTIKESSVCATFTVSVYTKAIHTAVHRGVVLHLKVLSLCYLIWARGQWTAGYASGWYSKRKPKKRSCRGPHGNCRFW